MRTPKQIAIEDFGFDFIDDIQPRIKTIFGDSSFTDKIKNIQIESLLFAKNLILNSLPKEKNQWNEGDYGKFFAAHDIWEEIKKIKKT